MSKRKKTKKAPRRPAHWSSTTAPFYVVLVLACLAMLVSRIHFLEMPLDRDEAAYSYLGWMALSGGIPYVDFYEMKPPLLFYSYAVIVAIFGKSSVGLHIAATLIHGFSAFMIFKIGRRFMNAVAGSIAAMLFVIFGMNFQGAGFSLQSEHVVLAFALPGLFLTLKGLQDQRPGYLFWGGLLLSSSALVKQSAIFYCIGGVLLFVLYALPKGKWNWNTLRKGAGLFVAGAMAPILFFALVLLVVGALDDFWYWFYTHPTEYVAQRTWSESMPQLEFFGRQIISNHEIWIGMIMAGVVSLPFIKTDWRHKIFLFAFIGLGFLTIVPGFRFYGHYWQLFFPALCLVAPSVILLIRRLLQTTTWGKKLLWVPGILLLAGLVFHVIPLVPYYYQSDLNIVSKQAFQDNYFPEHKVLGNFLRNEMKPNDDLMVLGSEPQLYLYTKKKAPTRHFYMTYTSKDIPEALTWEDEVIDDITNGKPDYIVFMYEPFSWMFKGNSRRKLYNWAHSLCRARYETIAHIDLVKGLHLNPMLTGTAAARHSPAGHYITVYRRKKQ